MGNCEYCDYYKSLGDSDGNADQGALCSFANVMLMPDVEKPGMEYPCKDISYEQYLSREKASLDTSKLTPEDWKIMYKSKHPVAERNRSRQAV